jgi:hypothetical protein
VKLYGVKARVKAAILLLPALPSKAEPIFTSSAKES